MDSSRHSYLKEKKQRIKRAVAHYVDAMGVASGGSLEGNEFEGAGDMLLDKR